MICTGPRSAVHQDANVIVDGTGTPNTWSIGRWGTRLFFDLALRPLELVTDVGSKRPRQSHKVFGLP